jgi:signal transduction histidine kinase
MAEQVELARERDETLSKMKSDFISTAAHQLRTPLSGIRWAVNGLLEGDFGQITEDQKKIVTGVEDKNTELIGIVKTLLDTVSVEQGAFGFEFQDIRIDKEIETTVHELEYRVRKAGLSLEYKKEGESEFPIVNADSTRIRWVVNNLVENSLHYTPMGGHITVRLSHKPDDVMITITDTGIGIPSDELQFLFNRFFRGKKATKMRNDGNGLGLYIAKNIIDKHGGKIWAESEEGKGSTFYITLPVKKKSV